MDGRCVIAASREELGVSALFDDAAGLEDDDQVGAADRGDFMGYDHAGAAGEVLVEGLWIRASVSASRALVQSSSRRMAGSATIARARARRCRCPPESESPRSPTKVSSPAASESTVTAKSAIRGLPASGLHSRPDSHRAGWCGWFPRTRAPAAAPGPPPVASRPA